MKVTKFEFDTDFVTGHTLPVQVLRLYLKSGSVVRVWFGPKGIIMTLPENCKENGDVIWTDSDLISFGAVGKEKK